MIQLSTAVCPRTVICEFGDPGSGRGQIGIEEGEKDYFRVRNSLRVCVSVPLVSLAR